MIFWGEGDMYGFASDSMITHNRAWTKKGTGLFSDCVYCGSTAGWQMGQKGQDPEG